MPPVPRPARRPAGPPVPRGTTAAEARVSRSIPARPDRAVQPDAPPALPEAHPIAHRQWLAVRPAVATLNAVRLPPVLLEKFPHKFPSGLGIIDLDQAPAKVGQGHGPVAGHAAPSGMSLGLSLRCRPSRRGIAAPPGVVGIMTRLDQ